MSSCRSISELLGRIGLELAAAAESADACQATLADILPAQMEASAVGSLQSLDLLSQHMNELAGLLMDLSRTSDPGQAEVDRALSRLRLSDLGQRLRGQINLSAPVAEAELW